MIKTILLTLVLSISILYSNIVYSNTSKPIYQYSLFIPCMDITTSQVVTVQIDTVDIDEANVWIEYLINNISVQEFVKEVLTRDPSVTEESLTMGTKQFELFCKPIISKLIERGQSGFKLEHNKLYKES